MLRRYGARARSARARIMDDKPLKTPAPRQ
jgi:hypothetical protein